MDFLIRAFALFLESDPLPGCELHLYGDGPELGNLERTVKDLGLEDKALFLGKVDEENIVKVYNSFGVFAFPSVQEGFGFPIMEAQACGVPVVILKGALIPHESVGEAQACKDEQEMASAMRRLLTDEVTRSRVVQAGMIYTSGFTLENMARKTMDVYRNVLEVR